MSTNISEKKKKKKKKNTNIVCKSTGPLYVTRILKLKYLIYIVDFHHVFKGEKFHNFLFALQHLIPLLKRGYF